MKKNECKECKEWRGRKGTHKNTGSGAVWCLGFVGAAVYYLQQATTIWEGIFGLLKAMVWPALLIHKLLGFLGM